MKTWKQDSFDGVWDYYDDNNGHRLLAFVAQMNPDKERPQWAARFVAPKLLAADRNCTTLDEAKNYVEAMIALEQ